MIVYADTSALVKLVLSEPEQGALYEWLDRVDARILTCALTVTEILRAVRRSNVDKTPAAYEVLNRCGIINLDASLYEEAGRIAPPSLRSLDAIHLTAALHLRSQLGAFLTYDARLADAARGVGIRPLSIGA